MGKEKEPRGVQKYRRERKEEQIEIQKIHTNDMRSSINMFVWYHLDMNDTIPSFRCQAPSPSEVGRLLVAETL